MTVAIPVWNHMVSPVLDTAKVLRVYEISQNDNADYTEYQLPYHITTKASSIAESSKTLICGALSGELAQELDRFGVRVHPWIMGDVSSIISGYLIGDISLFEYTMPGCRRMAQRCGRQSCRGRHGERHRNGANKR